MQGPLLSYKKRQDAPRDFEICNDWVVGPQAGPRCPVTPQLAVCSLTRCPGCLARWSPELLHVVKWPAPLSMLFPPGLFNPSSREDWSYTQTPASCKSLLTTPALLCFGESPGELQRHTTDWDSAQTSAVRISRNKAGMWRLFKVSQGDLNV